MFWTELPAALRTDMALELAGPIFRHSDIFKGMDRASERLVATRLTPLVVPAGHNIVQEGDDADALFLLQEGARLPRNADPVPFALKSTSDTVQATAQLLSFCSMKMSFGLVGLAGLSTGASAWPLAGWGRCSSSSRPSL